ncbi:MULTISPECIES: RNA polymerase sigma-70 factor [Mumia]|uniref:RNA polymerase sigma-70 factor n=1 Tax=Mumia TaxID=1546255 RepID=UPI0014246AEF|nr:MULTISPECIES: RNA polymerase sigma-70 factor [unclassified Mumia]QMW66620.1 RNA polymerase sigma-70 factor [Mumia sp. ZJ1417]
MNDEPETDNISRQLFSIAYRMTGSASDAEDLVQEAHERLLRAFAAGTVVESKPAFLTTITTRLAIDHLRSARVRRESYVGTWLPEPVLTDPDPSEHAAMSDSLSLSFLVLLERLSPIERAVFLLREVFVYPYDEIAKIVNKSEGNCRQVFSRARTRISEGRPRFEASSQERELLTTRFKAAAEDGQVGALVELLAADAVFQGDGGGKARAVAEPVFGNERVARLLIGFFKRYASLGARLEAAHVNGQPGLLAFDADDHLINVLALDIHEGTIQTVRSIINPDKLAHLGYPVSDIARIGPPDGQK